MLTLYRGTAHTGPAAGGKKKSRSTQSQKEEAVGEALVAAFRSIPSQGIQFRSELGFITARPTQAGVAAYAQSAPAVLTDLKSNRPRTDGAFR